MATPEVFRTSREFEKAVGRRAGGGFIGNRRFLDLFNNYTSKQYARNIDRMYARLSEMGDEIGKHHEHDDREYAQKSFESFRSTASEFIKHVDQMSSFHADVKSIVERAKNNLESEGKVNLEDQRAVLGWLGRGNVGEKLRVLQRNVSKYSKIAESLKILVGKPEGRDHYEEMDELHSQIVDARGAYLDAQEKLEKALKGKLAEETQE